MFNLQSKTVIFSNLTVFLYSYFAFWADFHENNCINAVKPSNLCTANPFKHLVNLISIYWNSHIQITREDNYIIEGINYNKLFEISYPCI